MRDSRAPPHKHDSEKMHKKTSSTVMFRPALAAIAAIAAATSARGAGFALEEGSARGNANPASLMTRGLEPGALYFNPAGIVDLPGTQTQIGSSFILP